MKQSSDYSASDTTKIPMSNESKDVESAWGILSGSDVYHASSDATLFSSSLPVLPHIVSVSLKLNDTDLSYQSLDDITSDLNNLHQDVEGNDPLGDIEAHALGNLLPDDENELLAGIADDFDLSELPSSLEDLEEYGLFGSRGDMELETDPQESLTIGMSKVSLSEAVVGNGMAHYGLPNGDGTIAGEHPYGEHPSRTLFVQNINSNVEDSELRALFEKLEYIALRTRNAEQALKSLNRSDIAGKRIKLEPSLLGGARRNLMLQLNQELEQDESQGFRLQVGFPIANSPPGSWAQFNSPIEHSPMHSLSKSPVFGTMSPMTSNQLPGLASILHPQVSNSMKVAPIGKDQGRGSHVEHSFTSTNSTHGAGFQLSHSLPVPKLSQYHGTIPTFGPSNGSRMETLSGPQFL
ncbi:hypothetical protein CRYUN_Cryun34aG0043300 [Craigia yunnanensis]